MTPVSGLARHPWAGQTAAIATKHEKQRQFGPPLAELVGLDVIVADVDTDLLGTFSGDVARQGSPLATVRRKAQWAIERTGARFGLASEGSFGPHPEAPFVAVGVEVAICLDARDGLEVVEQLVAATNLAHVDIGELPVPAAFLDAAGFPDHALVVSPSAGAPPTAKGLVHLDDVERAVTTCLDHGGRAHVQTDMRAHVNPTRQQALAELADRLGRRAASCCPRCGAPGWGVVVTETGLPCEWCARPTPLVACDVFGCARAGCEEWNRAPRADLAPAGECPACNP